MINHVTSADGGWRVLYAFVAQQPAASELHHASHRLKAACLSWLCLLLIGVALISGCATCGRSSVPASEKQGGDIWSDRSLWGGLLDVFGTH